MGFSAVLTKPHISDGIFSTAELVGPASERWFGERSRSGRCRGISSMGVAANLTKPHIGGGFSEAELGGPAAERWFGDEAAVVGAVLRDGGLGVSS